MNMKNHTVQSYRPTLWIGKNGVSKPLVDEACRQLNKNEIIKVKVLKNILRKKDLGSVISNMLQQTRSEIIEKRGKTFLLYKIGKVKKTL
jgi:RNA-binding protein YhbY